MSKWSNKRKLADKFRKSSKSRGEIVPTYKLDDGTHKFRVWPPHKDSDAFIYLFTTAWVPAYVYDRDKDGEPKTDKKGNKLTRLSRAPVFNACVHGGYKKDIIEEYIKFAEFKLPEEEDEGEARAKIDLINDFRNGISFKNEWLMYVSAVEKGELGTPFILSLTDAQEYALEKIATQEQDSEGPLEADPFSDPEEGRCIKITKDSKAKHNKDKYDIQIDTDYDKKTKQLIFYPISEEDLESFYNNFESLESRFGAEVYRVSDFERALEGLKMFDEENKIGLFEYEDWIKICEEFSDFFEELKEEQEAQEQEQEEEKPSKKSSAKKPSKKVSREEPEEEEDPEEDEPEEEEEPNDEAPDFSKMSRKELKIYIAEEEIPIIVTKKKSDDDIREELSGYVNGLENEPNAGEEEEEGDVPFEDGKKSDDDKPKKKRSIKDIRSRLKKM